MLTRLDTKQLSSHNCQFTGLESYSMAIKEKTMISEISVAQAAAIAAIVYQTNRFFCLLGKGGTGKTSIASSVIAPAIDAERTQVLNLSGSSPMEALGYGIPDASTRDLWFSCPENFPTKERVGNEKILLVLDEFPDWDVAVQSLFRSCFDPHGGSAKIGTHELGPNVKIMITGNRRKDGSSKSAVLSAPQVERQFTYVLEPTLDEWTQWVTDQGFGHSPILTFLDLANGLEGVDHFNPEIGRWDGAPHPCPRTWDAAIRAVDQTSDLALQSLLLEGSVGVEAGAAAMSFLNTVATMLPVYKRIRSGQEVISDYSPSDQYGLVHCALRNVLKETASDPEAEVAGGAVDWCADRFLLSAKAEIGCWGYAASVRNGLPLDKHSCHVTLKG